MLPGDEKDGLPLQEQMRELVDWHDNRADTPLALATTFDFPATDVPPKARDTTLRQPQPRR